MKLSYLIRGTPGHPLHPPLTDATIGIYSFATIAALLDVFGVTENTAAQGWWIALLVGLIVTVPTALSGLAEWFTISRGTPLWRTATLHLCAMVLATVFFGIAALIGQGSYDDGDVATGPFVLTLVGFALLTLGGWLGGMIVYTYGMRVLQLQDEPVHDAMKPLAREREADEAPVE